MAVKTTATKSAKKDTKAPAKKAPAKTTASKPAAKPAAKTTAKPAAKPAVKTPAKATASASTKTAYHVSKRDENGREWKVFIQGSDKVIKLFKTQADALEYAKGLAKNKDDGSYVLLHGLDGKIGKY